MRSSAGVLCAGLVQKDKDMKKAKQKIWERLLEKCSYAERKEEKRTDLERCVCCGKYTDISLSMPVSDRKFYVLGVGQLCEQCYFTLYPVLGALQSNLGNIRPAVEKWRTWRRWRITKRLFQNPYRPWVSSAVELTRRSARRKVIQLIGDKIRKSRKKKGLSQERLGELVSFSQSKISKIENEDWDSLSDLSLIAKVLEVPIEELVKDEPDWKMSGKSSVGNMDSKRDTNFSNSEGKKECHGTRKMRIPCPREKTVS